MENFELPSPEEAPTKPSMLRKWIRVSGEIPEDMQLELLTHPDRSVRAALAGSRLSPKTWDMILDTWHSSDITPEARNPSLQTRHLRKLVKKAGSINEIELLCTRPNLPMEIVEMILGRPESDEKKYGVYIYLLSNQKLPLELQNELAEKVSDPMTSAQSIRVGSPGFSAEETEALLRGGDPRDIVRLIYKTDVDQGALVRILGWKHFHYAKAMVSREALEAEVIDAIFKNFNLDDVLSLLCELSSSSWSSVREERIETLTRESMTGDMRIKRNSAFRRLLRSPRAAPRKLLEQALSGKYGSEAAQLALRNKAFTAEDIEKALERELSYDELGEIAKNPNLTAEQQIRLSFMELELELNPSLVLAPEMSAAFIRSAAMSYALEIDNPLASLQAEMLIEKARGQARADMFTVLAANWTGSLSDLTQAALELEK